MPYDTPGLVPLPRNFTLVQALRGIAAFWVVLFHAAEGGHVSALLAALPMPVVAFVFHAGHYGVPVFFALSGFVIAHSLRDATMTLAFLGRFALRRSIRLDPPYWASMLLVVALGYVSARVKHESFVLPAPGTVAAHVAYIQEILRLPEINPAYWTLTYEVQFYLFLAGMLVLAHVAGRRSGRGETEITWAAFFLLAIAGTAGLLDRAPAGSFVTLWKDFFVGALAYRAAADRRQATLGALLLLAAAMMVASLWRAAGLFSLMSAATALLLYGAVRTGRAEHGLDWSWLRFLGAVSYSLYLVHSPITGAAGFVVHRLMGGGVLADVVTLAAIVAASVVAAALFWRVIERASHRWSRRVALPTAAEKAPHLALSPEGREG